MEKKTIQVQMLGEFSLLCGDTVVSSRNDRSRKAKNLAAYLIYHKDRMIPVEELIRILDGGQRNTAPIAAFRTLLYRVRRTMEPIQNLMDQPLIITQAGMYGWNPEIPLELDVQKFEVMCRTRIPEGPGRPERYLQLLKLYRGDFLSNLSSEQWVEPLAEYYREFYLAKVEEALPVLMDAGLVRAAEQYCRGAIRLSPYREPLYRWLMHARAEAGDGKGAAAVYEELRTRLYEDLGVVPEESTQKVYRGIALTVNGGGALTPDGIRDQLQEFSPAAGALVCDYNAFKLFYQAEARAAARRGDAIHIGVLSVLSRDGKPLPARSLERAMEQLHIQISKSLRTGDIASCCSSSQYILMLVQANYENSKKVCDRVVQAFLRSYPRSPVRLQTAVFPLEPMFGREDREERRELKFS